MVEQDVKEYVKKVIGKLGESLNNQLNERVFVPMEKIVAEMKEIKGKNVENNENKPCNKISVMNPLLNMLPIHLKHTIGFTLTFITMVDGNKEPDTIANRVLEEYGTVMGKALVNAINDAADDTKKNKLKNRIKDVKKIMDGTI